MDKKEAFADIILGTKFKNSVMDEKQRFWAIIDVVIKYLESHPEGKAEMMKLRKSVLDYRANTFNKFGSNKDKTFRKLVAIPYKLMLALETMYPDGLPYENVEFYRQFAKRYPDMRYVDTI